MSTLKNKTIFITGGSRGIGEAIAIRAAKDGANIVIASKTTKAHPKLPGTIYTVAENIENAGGQALPIETDIRSIDQIKAAVDKTVDKFGGIDIVINNASAIFLAGTVDTPIKRFDLMHEVNVRGTFATSQACLPYLLKSKNPHILMLSPPLDMDAKWFKNHLAYTMAKYGMSQCVLGLSAEYRKQGVAVNALWPRTTIATAAVKFLLGGDKMISKSRTPEIVADAAHWVFTQDSSKCSGNFFIDEEILKKTGKTSFDEYAIDPKEELQIDLFI